MSPRKLFRKEITLVIIIKLLALTLIWFVCFSHPLSKKLTPQTLAQHYLMDN